MPLSNLEISKDTLQTAVESGFEHVGRIASIITGAGRDITREIGEWATDVFEMRDAAARARADRADPDPEMRDAKDRARTDRVDPEPEAIASPTD